MSRMHNPPHPGEVLSDTVLRTAGGLTVTALAARLGVSRVALSRVVNGRAAVSAELAIRLAAALGGGAESWLRMQVAYDLWQAQKKRRPKMSNWSTLPAALGDATGASSAAADGSLSKGLITPARNRTLSLIS